MTLIECFDRSVNANIVSCLHLRPKKVIFLGDDREMNDSIDRYRDFFRRRTLSIELKPQAVRLDRMEEIADTLLRIVRQEAPCVIDVTGGDERLLMAAGVLLSKLPPELRKQVSIQKFDKETGLAQDCDGDGKVMQGQPANVTVEELIRLHYGRPFSNSGALGEQYRAKDLAPLWKIACTHSDSWNTQMTALIHIESKVAKQDRQMGDIHLSKELLEEIRAYRSDVLENAMKLLGIFLDKGIVSGVVSRDRLDYYYTSPLYRYCTEKQGNILEVKTLLEAREVLKDGKPYFHDCLMSVNIDWEKPDSNKQPQTRNEMDLILTRGLVPLFISCKNGETDEEELYKMNSVATRFGGPDAKKLLVATQLKIKDGKSVDKFIHRAEDMGIHIITNAKDLEKTDWRDAFYTAFQKQSH